MGLVSIVSWEDDVLRCSGSGVTKLFPQGHAPWNTFTVGHVPAQRPLQRRRKLQGWPGRDGPETVCKASVCPVSPNSGSSLGWEQSIHVTPIRHLGARLLLVGLLQVLGKS